MACARMAASGAGSISFIDDVTHNGSGRMNSAYRNIVPANLQ